MKLNKKQKQGLKYQFKQLQIALDLSHWKLKLTFRETKRKKGSVMWGKNPDLRNATINISPNKSKNEKDLIRVLLHEFYHLLLLEINLCIAKERQNSFKMFENDWDNLERLLGLSDLVRKRKGFSIEEFNNRHKKK